ncbi:MAG: cytochrome c [Candidatus Rokubacteria bacterium]|nr:cytochrome c [Candidatus Rokubacteria bacterium]
MTAAIAATALVAGSAAGVVWAQGGDWKAPADAKATKNPLADKKTDKALLAEAKKLVETNCVTCHGADGKGTGPAASALPPPKPADWTSAKVKAETDGELFWKIANGRGAMPPWKHLPDNDRWKLVDYIRSLQK